MFGILEKMDRFSNNLMTSAEVISFIQELVDTGMIYDMHDKYQEAAIKLYAVGDVELPPARLNLRRAASGVAL